MMRVDKGLTFWWTQSAIQMWACNFIHFLFAYGCLLSKLHMEYIDGSVKILFLEAGLPEGLFAYPKFQFGWAL
jgi:hypothetical protein